MCSSDLIETRAAIDVGAFCAHAADCDSCRQLWEEHLLLNRVIAEWKSELLEVDLADAVLAQYAFSGSLLENAHTIKMPEFATDTKPESRPKVFLHSVISGTSQRSKSRQRRSALAVLAATALVLFLIAAPFTPTAVVNQKADVEQLAAKPPTPSRVASTEEIAKVDAIGVDATGVDATGADVEALLRDAGSAYMELARDAASVFTDTVVFIPEQTLSTAFPADALDSNSNDSERLIPWGQELDLIRRDVGHAIDFLFETISSDAEPAT